MPSFNEPHLCPDWDYLLIVPNNPEMKSCTCGSNGYRLKSGVKVKTDFYSKEKNKIRIVKECFIAPTKSQSGWYIHTEDGLSCDAGWFS
jgi:hypothetical protein